MINNVKNNYVITVNNKSIDIAAGRSQHSSPWPFSEHYVPELQEVWLDVTYKIKDGLTVEQWAEELKQELIASFK
jgi:hypothetical protein